LILSRIVFAEIFMYMVLHVPPPELANARSVAELAHLLASPVTVLREAMVDILPLVIRRWDVLSLVFALLERIYPEVVLVRAAGVNMQLSS
jgi:hypothetical protein